VRSIDFYQKAEEAAEFSPEDVKNAEMGVALRGAGYVFVEMGELDKAEEKYRKCLEIDPADNKARAELGYIRKVKNSK
jgi:tetratricopeptide (TPR) repeat protein